MDSNKDEALRCIEVAEKYIKERKKEKAQKFLYKAERLFPTQRAKGTVTDGKLIRDLKEYFYRFVVTSVDIARQCRV